MAIFRKIHVQFWSDPFVQSLSPEKRYFFLYLLTNEKTRQCGIYEISKRHISYDTGYTIDTVSILLEYFISEKKIMFSEATNEIAIKNWNKYNGNPSPKVQKLVYEELSKIKNKKLIQYLYPTDTVSIHNQQEEEEIEQEEEQEVEVDVKKGKAKFFKPNFDYEIDLPEMDVNRAIEYIAHTKHVKATKPLILSLWGAFKTKSFTGEKPYKNDRDIIRHFFESLKFQKIDGKQQVSGTNKSVGRTIELDEP